MAKQWTSRMVRLVWTIARDPVRRNRWWRRIRRGCGIALILLLLLSCLSCLLLGVLVGQVSATDADAGLDVMLVVDNSNSMFDKGGVGSDPHLRRIEAAQMFINYLGVDSSQGSHYLGVIFFGGEAELVVPLTSLADQARRAEMAALIGDPQRMEWTDPVAALTLARDVLLGEQGDDSQPVVVLLTDGKPQWNGDPTNVERQVVIQELERLGRDYAGAGIRLFVILLSNEATDVDREIETVYAPLWRELTGGTQGRFYPVRQADDLIAVYHDILVVLSGVQTAGTVVEAEIEDETQVEVVTIEPNLARATFVVRISRPDASAGLSTSASTGITVTIHRPNGRPIMPGDDDVQHAAHGSTAIWAITRPRPGDWTVVMTGQGTVTVWKDYVPAPATPMPTLALTATSSPTPVPTATPSPTPAVQRLRVEPYPSLELVTPEAGDTWQAGGSATVAGWAWIAGLGLFLVGPGGWVCYRWFQRLPRLAGRLRVLEAPAEYTGPTLTDLSLLDRRSARVGGAEAELSVPAKGPPWAVVRALPDGSGMEIAPCDGREVRVNEAVVAGAHLLSDGDRIAVDGVRLRYEYLHYGL